MHYFVAVFTKEPGYDAVHKALEPFCECDERYCSRFIPDDDGEPCGPGGEPGYWDNPDAHYDWYEIGGRFTDIIRALDGAPENKFQDQCKLIHQDLQDPFYNEEVASAAWDMVVDGVEPPESIASDVQYFANHRLTAYALKKYRIKRRWMMFQKYVVPYAYLTSDGEWRECSDDDTAQLDAYVERYTHYMMDHPTEYITGVDVHI